MQSEVGSTRTSHEMQSKIRFTRTSNEMNGQFLSSTSLGGSETEFTKMKNTIRPRIKTIFLNFDKFRTLRTIRGYGYQRRKSSSRDSEMCGFGNLASYGDCLASTYKRLYVRNSTTPLPAFPGTPQEFFVVKLDAYNQTIRADSSSVLGLYSSLDGTHETDPMLSFVGYTIARFDSGQAQFRVGIVPSFEVSHRSIKLFNAPKIFFAGVDLVSGANMVSAILDVVISTNRSICSVGYVISFSSAVLGSNVFSGVCTYCEQGTYSLNPIAPSPDDTGSLSPSCLKCPVGGQCLGGRDVLFSVGNWSDLGDYYKLISCPEGYSRSISDNVGSFSQEDQVCSKCLDPIQYIINPNQDVCQQCPEGLICRGDSVVVPRMNSTWLQNGSLYLLTECPTGYGVYTGLTRSFDASAQSCMPCPAGQECPSQQCVKCSPCKAGFYKEESSVNLCKPCPADTYSEVEGGQTLKSCISCTARSTTGGLVGANNKNKCICLQGYYPVINPQAQNLGAECQQCPQGALCPENNTCSLSNKPIFTCRDGGPSILGDWQLDVSTGQYHLVTCPAGYELLQSSESCGVCPTGFFCVSGSDSPLPCPAGSFSSTGANSSQSCLAVFFVALSATLPMSSLEFSLTAQEELIQAVADTAHISESMVFIASVSQGRRASTSSVLVQVNLAAFSVSDAQTISRSITQSSLNDQLERQGLPPCALDSLSIEVQSSNQPTWLLGAVVGSVSVVCVLFVMVILALRTTRSKSQSDEDRILHLKVQELRIKLGLTTKHGYYLTSERLPFWKSSEQKQVLLQTSIEAAARLALGLDFHVHHFDALSLALRESEGDISALQYRALCDWLLEISKELIRPDTQPTVRTSNEARRGAAQRFKHFSRYVCHLQIWKDEKLFEQLKKIAQDFLDEVEVLCDQRLEELCGEPKGVQLLSFPHPPGVERTGSLPSSPGFGSVPTRQDHPQVFRKSTAYSLMVSLLHPSILFLHTW